MANSLDKFRKGVAQWSGNIGSAGISDAVVKTVPLASTSGLPTDTAVMITVNRVDANGKKTGNYEGIVGVVSGSNLIDCIRGVEGTAQAWTGGTVVEVLHTASNINELIDGILAEHNQDGTHKDTLVTSLKATGAEITTGTEDAKIVTPKALADAGLVKDTDGTLAANSDSKIASQKAVKTYVDSGTVTMTNKTLTSPVFNGNVDGWISANETWTYASATTITVPSGAVSKYNKGDKFKVTSNGSILQGYIVGIADTLLTVAGDTLTNYTFTNNYYSHASSPLGFPTHFSCNNPVWDTANIDDGSGNQPGADSCYFNISGGLLSLFARTASSGVYKAGTGGVIRFTLPSNLPNMIESSYISFGVGSAGGIDVLAIAQSVSSNTGRMLCI